ncbi:hypothetical protein SAMN06273572_102119 [Monaibacterium marinum]|uniref:Uncharacterized protein n=1 Tax=Pontivivens marinum TaxID=1690039 RepID=A0A2C9CQF0_9RHOB|nr:hypothetical protein [Monaibacterium marinum]SOH93443.1 hypothetical protein SAMN06273572_102119 [Monaibacterium marinum]
MSRHPLIDRNRLRRAGRKFLYDLFCGQARNCSDTLSDHIQRDIGIRPSAPRRGLRRF